MLQIVYLAVSGGHFKQLFKWRFDRERVAQRNRITDKRKKHQIKGMLEMHTLDHDLGLSDNFDFLNLFYPCFEQHIPEVVREFYDFLTKHVVLIGTGMGGVSFRETKAGLSQILEANGYCSVVTADFVDAYESGLMEEYHDQQEKAK